MDKCGIKLSLTRRMLGICVVSKITNIFENVRTKSKSKVGRPPKLVLYRNNRNWNRNDFRHYPKQDVCFGCFALILNREFWCFETTETNKQPNKTAANFVKISTFLIPHTKSSVCFGCFDTGPKHRTKTDWVSVCFDSNQEKKLTVLRTYNKELFWRFFRFVSRKFCLFRLFRYRSETPKQSEKKFFGFAKQTEKQPKQIDFRFVSVWTEKKIRLLRGHPNLKPYSFVHLDLIYTKRSWPKISCLGTFKANKS